MSRNYDNWERLVAAVLKRDQIWQLCHQDSISICSDSSWDSEFSLPVSLESFGIADTFKFETSNLTTLSQNLQEYFGRGPKPKSVVRLLDMLLGDRSRPNWETLIRIAVGAARGIAHIHAQCGGKLFHGNIQSSNIFVNRQRRDELQKEDVYSFGLLLLELVTHNHTSPSYVVHYLRSFELFERDMSRNCFVAPGPYVDELDMISDKIMFPFVAWELRSGAGGSEVREELVKMLLVAKRCLAELTQDRPTMSEVVLMLDNITFKQDVSVSRDFSPQKRRVWQKFLPFSKR